MVINEYPFLVFIVSSITSYSRPVLFSFVSYFIISICYYVALKRIIDPPKWCIDVASLCPEEQCKYLKHFEIMHHKKLTTVDFPIGIEQYLTFSAIEEEYYDLIEKIDTRLSQESSDYNNAVQQRIDFWKNGNHNLLKLKGEINDIILPLIESEKNIEYKNIFEEHPEEAFIVWFPKNKSYITRFPRLREYCDDDGIIKFKLPLNANQLYHIENDLII